MMEGLRWQRIQDVFHRAVALPEATRAAFVRSACGGDPDLEAEVLALIDEDARGASVLDGDVARIAGAMFGPEGASPSPPIEFGPYRIRSILGEGGMGTVYLAERTDLGSLVAVKILRDAWLSPARRERFASEQRTLAQLNHPSIAQLHDAGSLSDGTPWFVMEYVEGEPLNAYCRSRATSIEGRLELFRKVCEAVQHAHGHAVIHRDLKPTNVFIKRDGTVKLLDFGIAKHLESLDATVDQTRTGLRLMTPAYAAPEQIRGDRVGIHTDVYSLGVLLYELLAGRLPFDLSGKGPLEAAGIVAEQEPERPSVLVQRRAVDAGDVPRSRSTGHVSWSDLDVLCLTAMHKDPSRRYRTVDALIRDIDHYVAGEPLEARPDSVRYRLGKFVRRHRAGVATAVVVTGLIAGLVAFYTMRLARARDVAAAEAERTARIQRFMLDLFEGGDEAAGPAESLRVVTLVDRGVQEARSLDAEPLVQAELYGTLGGIYRKLGNLARADELLTLSLDKQLALLGTEHPDVAASLVALGQLRSDEAKYDEAERLVRDGLERTRRALPAQHPAVAAATFALGHVLVERGSYARALEVLEEAARLQSRQGSATPALAATLFELANAHFYEGHLNEAEALSRRVLSLSRSLYGDRHPHVADDLVNLGAVQHEQGRYAESESLYREALDIVRSWYGNDHYQTASVLTMLGRSLVFQKRYDEAEDPLKEALAIQQRVFGPDHPRVASALNELGTVALQRDHFNEAEAAFRRMASIYRKTYAGHHYLIGIAVSNLASVDMARKRYPEAERSFHEAIDIYAATLPPDHLTMGIARIKLGRCLVRQRRYAEAERETVQGYGIVAKQADPSIGWIRSAREDLVTIYDALGREDEAEKVRADIAEHAATQRSAAP